MGYTIGKRWPASAPRGDSAALCDYCGVQWRRSQLRRDGDGKLACPDEGSGRAVNELARLNAQGPANRRVRPVSSKVDTDDGASTPDQRTTLNDIYDEA